MHSSLQMHPWVQKREGGTSSKEHAIFVSHRRSNAKNRIEHAFFVETSHMYRAREKLSRLEDTQSAVAQLTPKLVRWEQMLIEGSTCPTKSADAMVAKGGQCATDCRVMNRAIVPTFRVIPEPRARN